MTSVLVSSILGLDSVWRGICKRETSKKMISWKLVLKRARPTSSLAVGGAAALASLACLTGLDGSSKPDENTHDEQRMDKQKDLKVKPIVATMMIPKVASCDFLADGLLPRLARSRTIRRIEETCNKETLKARYHVNWKKPVGEGGFGAVYVGVDKKSKQKVAIKKIPKRITNDSSFQQEMNAFLHIRHKGGHPNICGLKENYDEGEYYYLVLDLIAGGEMFDHLISNGAYSEADAARLMREVGSALAFLHGIQLVHGDLKPENLMLSSENPLSAAIKVVDFGCAQILDENSPYFEETTHIAATTPGYSPAEMIDQKKNLTQLCPSMDMFAVGVILFVMLCGAHPFDLEGTASDQELNQRVLSGKMPSLRKSPFTAHLSPSAIDLIEKLVHPNPRRRLTAQQMLMHPWVRGETARTGKMRGSDERLSKYRKYKSKLEAKVFQSMVELSDGNDTDVNMKTSLIERSFQLLDPENKGYITTNELQQLGPDQIQGDGNDEDDQLSLSGFSDLLSDNMKNRYFPAGHVIYKEGTRGNKMYFINSGRIEVSTRDGFKTTVEQGDFFGEGALLSKSGRRSATIKCLTPVHAIEIGKEYFEKYLADGYGTHLSLREKDKTRKRNRAKTILASAQNMQKETYNKGAYFYREGDTKDDVFFLEAGDVDVTIRGNVVFKLQPGELFGQQAAVFYKPRNNSAKCVSKTCTAQILPAEDFRRIVHASSMVEESLGEITLRREFRKAWVFATGKPFPTEEKELWQAFKTVDHNSDGSIELSDIAEILKNMDDSISDNDIQKIMQSLDLDGTGEVNWEEFKRVFVCRSEQA